MTTTTVWPCLNCGRGECMCLELANAVPPGLRTLAVEPPTPDPDARSEALVSILDVELALRDMAKAKGGSTGAECESLADALADAVAELMVVQTVRGT